MKEKQFVDLCQREGAKVGIEGHLVAASLVWSAIDIERFLHNAKQGETIKISPRDVQKGLYEGYKQFAMNSCEARLEGNLEEAEKYFKYFRLFAVLSEEWLYNESIEITKLSES